MNIDELTIGQAKELSRFFGSTGASESSFESPLGKKCIVRTYASGVHFGEVVQHDGRQVELKNARRLWYWKTKEGISLSEIAISGVHSSSKVCTTVPVIFITDALELIPAEPAAVASIEAQPVHAA